jgi:hypothetical protein
MQDYTKDNGRSFWTGMYYGSCTIAFGLAGIGASVSLAKLAFIISESPFLVLPLTALGIIGTGCSVIYNTHQLDKKVKEGDYINTNVTIGYLTGASGVVAAAAVSVSLLLNDKVVDVSKTRSNYSSFSTVDFKNPAQDQHQTHVGNIPRQWGVPIHRIC